MGNEEMDIGNGILKGDLESAGDVVSDEERLEVVEKLEG